MGLVDGPVDTEWLTLLVGNWKTSSDNFEEALFACQKVDSGVQCNSKVVHVMFPSNATRSTKFPDGWTGTYLSNGEIRWTMNETFKFCWKKEEGVNSETHCTQNQDN